MPIKVTQIIYSGLGGHGAVAFSFTGAAAHENIISNAMLFYGIEPVREEYIQQCAWETIPFDSVLKNKGIDVASYKAVFSILKKQRPQVVILHSVVLMPVVYLASLVYGFSIIAVEHQANHLKRRSEWWASALCLLLAKKVVYLTEAYREEIRKKFPLLYRNSKVKVIPNGIDVAYFRPVNKGENDVFCYGMISRLNELKDHETLLNAFAQLKEENIRLIIAGEGPTLPALQELSRRLGIDGKVVFTGLLQGDAVLRFFQDIDVYTHASLGETMSTALMQAMACGVPIIASDVKGISNMVVDTKTGLLVKPKNAMALAAKMKALKENKSLRASLASGARQYAEEHFSSRQMFCSYLSIIKS